MTVTKEPICSGFNSAMPILSLRFSYAQTFIMRISEAPTS